MKTVTPREAARRARHHAFMMGYYAARQADLAAMEAYTAMYEAEVQDYIEQYGHPMYFKRWLIESRGMPR